MYVLSLATRALPRMAGSRTAQALQGLQLARRSAGPRPEHATPPALRLSPQTPADVAPAPAASSSGRRTAVPGQLRTATGLTAGFHGNTTLVTAPSTASWPVQTLVLQPDPRSMRAARVFVQTHCAAAQLPSDTCDMAVLLTSEVVTNALLHGRSQVRLAVLIDQTGLTQVGETQEAHLLPGQPGHRPSSAPFAARAARTHDARTRALSCSRSST